MGLVEAAALVACHRSRELRTTRLPLGAVAKLQAAAPVEVECHLGVAAWAAKRCL